MLDLGPLLEQIRALDFAALGLAMVLGGALGLERELHGRPAGMRTHMLVCMCSCALMLGSHHLPNLTGGEFRMVFDPQRLAAGIVTGIGFLGAASVVRSGDIVRGVTTGASVWCVAGLGVLLGEGDYGLAVVITVAYLFVLVVLDWLPRGLGLVVYRRLRVRGRSAELSAVVTQVRAKLEPRRMRVLEIAGEVSSGDVDYELTFYIRCRNPLLAPTVLEELRAIADIHEARWMAGAGG